MMFAVVSGCQKDNPIPPSNLDSGTTNCIDFPELWISWFAEYRFQYKSPCFNPLNSNEFVYYFKDNELGIFQLMKYNMLTKQKSILVNGIKIWGQPKWSRKGWIAFTSHRAYVEHIFVVKDNGDSLIQITSSTANYDPVWNNDGTKIYWLHSTILGHPYYYLSRDLANGSIDTVLYPNGKNLGFCSNGDVSFENKLLGHTFINNKGFLGIANLNDLDFELSGIIDYYATFDYPEPEGLSWHSSGLYFFVSHSGGNRGIHKVYLNGNIQRIIKHCDNKMYSIISCSSDGKKLIAERIDSELEYDNQNNPTGKIIQKSSIWLIDLETLEETKIELD